MNRVLFGRVELKQKMVMNGSGMNVWQNYLWGFIGILVLFTFVAASVGDVQSAGDDLCNSGIPLGTLFAGTGIVFLLIAAGLLIKVVKMTQ